MTEHRPKTAALIAYAEDLLSADGRRRLEGHLEGCDLCRAELAAIQIYEEMIDDVRENELPEIDFGKMELPLAREADRISMEIRVRARRQRVIPWAVMAAAAAALLVFLAWPDAPEAPVAVPTPHERVDELPPPVEAIAMLSPTVTLSAGEAHRIDDDRRALVPGDVLAEEARLRTGEHGELHVRLSEGNGIRLGPGSLASLTRVREGDIGLTLEEGSLSNEVAPLRNGSTFVVLCSGYEVEVTGTRFVVSYVDTIVGVDLSEGSVLIRDPDGGETALEAPARWRSEGDASGEPVAHAVRSPAAPSTDVTLVTLDDIRLVRWEIDGSDVSTLGALQLQLTPGDYELRGWDAEGRLFTTMLPVGTTPVMLEPGAMTPDAPRIRPGHLDQEDIDPVMSRGFARWRQCYDRYLRTGAPIQGHARVRITIGVMGDVRRARVLGIDDAGLSQCIRNSARHMSFPPPGGPLTLEQPLSLATGR